MSSKDKFTVRDEAMFRGHVSDLVTASEYTVKTSGFLSPLEQRIAFDTAKSLGAEQRCFFWGGAPEAERRILVMIPDWMTPEEPVLCGSFDEEREDILRDIILSGADGGDISGAVCAVEISSEGFRDLEHKDYMGAILGLGIKRELLGDIVTSEAAPAIAFLLKSAVPFVEENLEKAGREGVKVEIAELPEGYRIPREFEVISDTVMSLRLDGLVKSLCKVSREDAASLVEKGEVTLNYIVETEKDAPVSKGDVISVRGHGKFIYDGDRGVNRRGRIRFDARKYI
ncbi:MAG: hypothetical protein E7660_02290 [Ruminococcaceae bacterium]|nr:hypothetical protein [Oscillospiraceae bacterium]